MQKEWGTTIKYSFIIPYYKRAGHFHNSLTSYLHHYRHRNDWEIIVVEDIKNIEDENEHKELLKVIDSFKNQIKIKRIESNFVDNYNPAPLFNLGAKSASGEYFIITNPETFHIENILEGADRLLKDGDKYIICSCLNVVDHNLWINNVEEFKYKPHSWYQHSKFRNALFHFCSCISKKNYEKINGFDERFSWGYAYDDDDFRNSIIRAEIPIVVSDVLLTLHISHHNVYGDIPNKEHLLKINKTLCCLKQHGATDEVILEKINEIRGELVK